MAWIQSLLTMCVLLAVVALVTIAEETTTTPSTNADTSSMAFVETKPTSVKKPVGTKIDISCTTTIANMTLNWLDANNDVISTNTSNRVHVTATSTLVLTKVEVEDSANYTCVTADGAHNATTLLTIYLMPDYFFEGMVILIINGCLIVIFFICLVHAWIRNKRQKGTQKKAEQKQVL